MRQPNVLPRPSTSYCLSLDTFKPYSPKISYDNGVQLDYMARLSVRWDSDGFAATPWRYVVLSTKMGFLLVTLGDVSLVFFSEFGNEAFFEFSVRRRFEREKF